MRIEPDTPEEMNRKVEEIFDNIDKPLKKYWLKAPRLIPERGNKNYEVLDYIRQNGPVTSSEIASEIDGNVTRILSSLYHSYLVDREGEHGNYRYEFNEMGEIAMRESGPAQGKIQPDPWDDTPISRGEYKTLELVYGYDGHPQAKDINDQYVSLGYNNDSSAYAVGARLSKLKDTPYLDRTPTPHQYWVTEEGKELLEEAQD